MPVVPVPKSLLAALKLAASCICILTLLTVASSSLFKRQNASPLPKKHGLFLPQSQNAAPTDKGQNKFFHESTFDNHYDGRFTMAPVSYEQRKLDLHNLAVSYLHTMREIGVETWLMHGTLLGWWWSRKNMPWDFDADVQMTAESLEFVAGHYNMSVWDFEIDENKWGLDVDGLKEEEEDGEKQDFRKADELKEEGNVQEEDGEEQDVGKADEENTGMDGRNVKSYLLEINPNYWRRDRGVISKANVIDGRWIDTTSGLYIDITMLWKDENHPAGSGMLVSKDGHEFKVILSQRFRRPHLLIVNRKTTSSHSKRQSLKVFPP